MWRGSHRCARRLSTLVVGESSGGKLAASTLNAVSAAVRVDAKPIRILVTNQALADEAAKIAGVDGVLVAQHDAYAHGLPENMSALISHLHSQMKFTHIVSSATSFGRNFSPRLAASLDVALISDVIEVKSADTFNRPTYAGNAVATIKSTDAVRVMTVRPTAFPPAEASGSSATIEEASLPDEPETSLSTWISDDIVKSERPELTSAKVVISGGRALKSEENFKMLYKLADMLNGAVGASRAAVDAGFCSNDLQIGQTGKVVAPDLYIAFGISGAIQHMAGCKDSKVIVAVNKDKESPIFQVADYGLVGDLFTIIPELEKALAK